QPGLRRQRWTQRRPADRPHRRRVAPQGDRAALHCVHQRTDAGANPAPEADRRAAPGALRGTWENDRRWDDVGNLLTTPRVQIRCRRETRWAMFSAGTGRLMRRFSMARKYSKASQEKVERAMK